MTTRVLFSLITIAASILLAGCSAQPARPPATPSNSVSSSPSPSPSSSPTASGSLVVTVDGISYSHSDTEETALYDDPANLLALVEKAIGASPEVAKVEDVPGYPLKNSRYVWDGIVILANETNASILVTSSTVNGIPVETEQGITVGSSRADVLASQGRNPYGDISQDSLALESRVDPGTNSLSNPGSVGMSFILLPMEGDAIERILSPANDYSDI